jgi:hypothetical protein
MCSLTKQNVRMVSKSFVFRKLVFLIFLSILMAKVWIIGPRVWLTNLCAVSLIKSTRLVAGSLQDSEAGCASDPLKIGENLQLLFLSGRKAMLKSDDIMSINLFKQILTFKPNDYWAHFWLTQLYDRNLDTDLAIREYHWLINYLPDGIYGPYNQEWANRRIKLNQELGLLLSAKSFLKKGDGIEAVPLLTRLIELQPGNTPARYYLFQAYQSIGDTVEARTQLPELPFFGYGPDERVSQLLNDVLPNMAVPIIEAGYWDNIQAENVASWLNWSGDQANSSRLINFAQKYWGNNFINMDDSYLLHSFSGPSLGKAVNREAIIRDYASKQLEISPGEIELGPDLVRNGSFEQQTHSFPDNWFFGRSAVLDVLVNTWKTDPRFLPVAGSEAIGLCNGHFSLRLQVVWSRSLNNDLFSATSQQIKLNGPGIYALGECYLITQGSLHVAVNQADRVLSDNPLLPSSQSSGYHIQLFQVNRVDQPIIVAIKYFGVGRTWLDALSLQQVILK